MRLIDRALRRAETTATSEDGGMTILALYVLAGALLISAFAVDFAYLQSARTQLQIAADSAAHAALYYRERHSEADAKDKAVEIASHDMPASEYGMVLNDSDVEFGIWSYSSNSFTPNSTARNAVRVRPSRAKSTGNPVTAHLFRLLGQEEWDILTESVFVTFHPPCLNEGFVAEGVVDIQSGNGFSNGFCIHSNTFVSLNQNNFFEPGTVVSMPDLSQLDLPKSGFEKNEGLQIALRTGYYRLRVLNRIEDIRADLEWGSGEFVPDYITNPSVISVSGKRLDATDFVENHIHKLSCTGGKTTIEAGTHLRKVVLMANCQVQFGQGVVLEDVVIFNSDQGDKSFYAPSSLSIGLDDDCAPGGGAQLITMGGFDVAADLRLYGGQIIAVGDIMFAANANGVQGASMIAGGEISGTSNMEMSFCGNGMEDNYTANYFRLAL